MTLARRAARNFGAQVAGFAATVADRLILTGLLVRAWGVNLFSDWSTLIAAAGLLAMADLGFQTFLGNTLTKAGVRNHDRTFARLVSLGVTFYLILAGLLIIGAAVFVGMVDIGEWLHLHDGRLATVLLLLLLYQTLRVSRSAFVQVLRGRGDNHMIAWTEVRSQIATVACVSGAVAAGAPPVVAAIVMLMAELLFGFGWSLLEVRRRFPQVSLRPGWPTRARARGGLAALRWYALFGISSYAWLNVPVLILAWLGLAGAPLASFVLQRTLVNFSRTVATQLANAIGLELARIHEEGRQGELRAAIVTVARFNIALSGLAAAGLVIFGRDLIALWTGRADLGSLVVLALLLAPVIAVACSSPLIQLSIYSGKLKAVSVAFIAQLVLGLPAAAFAGRIWGVTGFAAGLAAGEILALAIVLPALTAKKFHIAYLPIVATCAATLSVTLAWSALMGETLSWIPSGSMLITLGKLAAFGALAGLPVAWWVLPPGWRARLLARLGRRRSTGAA